jgi:hypothetical protein
MHTSKQETNNIILSYTHIQAFQTFGIHKHIKTSKHKALEIIICNLAVIIYICYVPFKLINILVHRMKSIIKHVTHHHHVLHVFHMFSLFCWWCRWDSNPWSYTCAVKMSLTLGLTFIVHDFIPCSCYHAHIFIMLMLSYIYASFNITCFS